MTDRPASITRSVLLVLSLVAAAGWAHFMYRAGCTADLKTGSTGNFTLALELELLAFACGLVACMTLALFASLSTARGLGGRSVRFVCAALAALALMLAGGVAVETAAIKACADGGPRNLNS